MKWSVVTTLGFLFIDAIARVANRSAIWIHSSSLNIHWDFCMSWFAWYKRNPCSYLSKTLNTFPAVCGVYSDTALHSFEFICRAGFFSVSFPSRLSTTSLERLSVIEMTLMIIELTSFTWRKWYEFMVARTARYSARSGQPWSKRRSTETYSWVESSLQEPGCK